jgi:hypothetical protein
MNKLVGFVLLLAGSAAVASAAAVPEIDPSAAVGAVVLLAGGLAVIRGRRKA